MTSFKDENIVVEATTFGLGLEFIRIVMVSITVIHFISNGILHLAYWKLFGENYIRVKVDPALMEQNLNTTIIYSFQFHLVQI